MVYCGWCSHGIEVREIGPLQVCQQCQRPAKWLSAAQIQDAKDFDRRFLRVLRIKVD